MALATALVAAGCGGSTGHHSSSPTSATTLPPSTSGFLAGAGLTVAVGPAPSTWNCDAAGSATPSCLAAADDVWPSVYRLDAAGSPQLDSSFVRSATVTSTHPQTVVYRINPKAVWSDGTPVTYQDFVYDWQAHSGLATARDIGGAAFTPAQTAGYSDIGSVTGSPTDPDTVTVTFAHPDPDWQALFGAGDPIVPAHVAQQVGFDHGFTDPVADLVSAGPFVVQSSVPGSSLTLVRNPKYWGPAAAASSVTLRFAGDPDQYPPALARSVVGVATVTGDPATPVGSDVYSALTKLDGVTVKAAPADTYQSLLLDEASPALADPALRRAILTAVSRSALLKLVPGADDAGIGSLGDRFAVPGGDDYSDDTGSGDGSGDASAARTILQSDGYTAMPDAPLVKGGAQITLRLTAQSGQPVVQSEEQTIVAALGQIGITVTESDSADVGATLAGTQWDLAIGTRTAVPFAGAATAAYLPGDPADVERVDDPKATQLLTQATTALDPTQRTSLLHQADQELWSDAADLPLFQLPAVLAYRSGVAGAAPAAGTEGPTADLASWGVPASS